MPKYTMKIPVYVINKDVINERFSPYDFPSEIKLEVNATDVPSAIGLVGELLELLIKKYQCNTLQEDNMAKAFFVVHIDRNTKQLKRSGIYSEWPLTTLDESTIDVCIFVRTAETYDEAYKKTINEILNLTMINSPTM